MNDVQLLLTPRRGPLADAQVRVDILVLGNKLTPWFFNDTEIQNLNVGDYHRNIYPNSICEATWRACLARHSDVMDAVLEFLEDPNETCQCCVCSTFSDREGSRWEAFWDFASDNDASGFDSFDFSEVNQSAAGRSFTR